MKTQTELNDEELDKVTGGANMIISKENNTITIDLQTGKDSINKLYAKTESLIMDLCGNGVLGTYFNIRGTLDAHKDKITTCVIDMSTFVPTYYVGNTAYTQVQIDQGILDN